ncbi:MAG: SbcC/MukB-like Walker B domain-containing protein, partial [Oliverpabstia sp.]
VSEYSRLDTRIQVCLEDIERKKAELEIEEKAYQEFEITSYTIVQKAVEAYDRYVENGNAGMGGIMVPETRSRLKRSIEQHKQDLIALQTGYNGKHPDGSMPVGETDREAYAKRKDRIWMDNLQEIREKLDAQTKRYEDIFKNEFVLTILKACENARDDLKQMNLELSKLNFSTRYQFDVRYVKDGSEYAKIIEYAKYLDEREKLGGTTDQMTFDMLTSISDEEGEQLEKELKQIINRIIEKNNDETIARFADYRNYMTYEILMSNHILDRAKLSRQTGFNSGAEVQIPYLLILSSALLMIYNQKVNSSRLVFIDEPFAKMDPGNVKLMLDFMRQQNLQVIFCSPDKTESIGNECEVILPVLRVRPDNMQLGIVQFHEEKAYA